jgi:2-polyprenyl-3-methyl-5-hydroxy-6-metoxy-1,4-benzoquinol methylase
MSDSYAALSRFYDALGMSEFALHAMPSILQFAQQKDWIGRRVVDLGCGTGGSVRWLASQGYNITAIDPSPDMLTAARRSIDSRGVALRWIQGDAHALHSLSEIDLVLSIDTINELNSVRELETTFTAIARALAPDKWFIFDLHTLEGLAADHDTSRVLRADEDITAVITSTYDHERQMRQDSWLLFHAEDALWTRTTATRARRGFPVQVVTALLGRVGFEVVGLVNTGFSAVMPTAPNAPRVLVFARRTR